MKRFDDMATALRASGYRLTPQRVMILEAIENSENHISAEEIYTQVHVRYPHVNISTVYRTLELLKRLGLVTETDFGERQLRYHPAGKGHHHHLVCKKCGAIIELDESLLDSLGKTLLEQYNFRADLRHLAIFGHCIQCQT